MRSGVSGMSMCLMRFGERIEHRVDDGGQAAGAACFAAALVPADWILQHRMIADRHHRDVLGARPAHNP